MQREVAQRASHGGSRCIGPMTTSFSRLPIRPATDDDGPLTRLGGRKRNPALSRCGALEHIPTASAALSAQGFEMSNQVALMSQQSVSTYGDRSLTAADVQAQVNLMQDVMRSTMFDGTHYGTIPGTKTKSLYKPGAEKLMATFRLACDPEVEDLGANGEAHYRVKVRVYSSSGVLLGAGIGECSSQEDKYAWRAAICEEEFTLTPENRKRIKFAKYQGKVEKKQQIRTNPADVANTILKMAKKRGLIDAILTVTAASDIFTQDIEDLPEELQAQVVADARAKRPAAHAVQQAMPEDSAERDAAIAACRAAAAKGTDHFRTWWKDELPKASRALVTDKIADFQAIASSADAMLTEGEL